MNSDYQNIDKKSEQIKVNERTVSAHISRDQEPIHIPGRIQSHGVLFVLEEPSLKIIQISNNTINFFGITPEKLLQKPLTDLLDKFQLQQLKMSLSYQDLECINPLKISYFRKDINEFLVFDGIIHRNLDQILIFELELAISQKNIRYFNFYHLIKSSVPKIQKASSSSDLYSLIVKEVRKITGFDRVMMYKFDQDEHGIVIAEDKQENLESYLGLHYPESDIPKQARKLYRSNWLRLIPNVNSLSVEIIPTDHPINHRPLDLSFSILRAASSCHIEYLKNTAVSASMSISLMQDHQLWGLIACHHQSPKYIPYEVRQACEFLGQIISVELLAKEKNEECEYRMQVKEIETKLIESISKEENFIDSLFHKNPNILDLVHAQGCAVCWSDSCTLFGNTPEPSDLNQLIEWLETNVDPTSSNNSGTTEIFYTDSLCSMYPDAEKFKEVASGLLAISISSKFKNYILWFRSEVIQTITWAGKYNHSGATLDSKNQRFLSDDHSFKGWKEIVKGKSLPWKACEIEAAINLRNAMINIVLHQADELAKLAQELARSNDDLERFAYIASHDLQEPLNLVAGYVQLLEIRYRDKLDQDARDFIDFAVEGVVHMQKLIDDLLAYSRVSSRSKKFEITNVETVLNRALTNLQGRISESRAVVTYDPLPTVVADRTQLLQLFQNLISNAIKFRSVRPLKIHVGAKWQEKEWLFSVQDNGIGIEAKFADRIFVAFERLHTRDEYPGTGIGLAICKKIVERLGGRIWVESQPAQGATFYFTIPAKEF